MGALTRNELKLTKTYSSVANFRAGFNSRSDLVKFVKILKRNRSFLGQILYESET